MVSTTVLAAGTGVIALTVGLSYYFATSGSVNGFGSPTPIKTCAQQGGTCNCMGTINYGYGSNWLSLPASGAVVCKNSNFASATPTYTSLGCYAEPNKPATIPMLKTQPAFSYDLPARLASSSSMTISMCANLTFAAGYKYFGLQNGQQCNAGNSYGSKGQASTCNVACAGSPSQNCGGPVANAIYQFSAPTPDASSNNCMCEAPTCASEGGTCQCVGNVNFGAYNNWVSLPSSGSLSCSISTFGSDPAPGYSKSCTCNSPVDCSITSTWGSWSACSATCGGGTQTRTLVGAAGSTVCPLSQSQPCNTQPCNCAISAYTVSGGCYGNCGDGAQPYTATVLTPASPYTLTVSPIAVVNPNFDLPAVPMNTMTYITPTAFKINGWVATAGPSSSYPVLINLSNAWGLPFPYPTGNQAVVLQQLGMVTQLFYLNAGFYQISFYACGRDSGANNINLSLNGVVFNTVQPKPKIWISFMAPFTVSTSGSNAISFSGTNTLDLSSAIQGISIVQLGQIVLTNNNFALPAVNSGSYTYASSSFQISGWKSTAGSDSNTPVLINSSGSWGLPVPYPNGNKQAVGLQNLGVISQTATMSAGTYQISFYACGRDTGSNPIILSLNGVVFFTVTPPNAWNYFTVTFAVSQSGSNVLSFAGTTPHSVKDVTTAITAINLIQLSQNGGVECSSLSVLNNNFDLPTQMSNTYTYITGSTFQVNGWTAINSPILMNVASAWNYPIPYPNGAQAMSLQGVGGVAQTLTLSAGTYQLTFWACGRPFTGVNTIQVALNGVTFYATTPPITWQYQTTTFTVTDLNAGDNVLSFAGSFAPGSLSSPVGCYADGRTTQCAVEGGTCMCNGMVSFGIGLNYYTQQVVGSIPCSLSPFGGDPAPGVAKQCLCQMRDLPTILINSPGTVLSVQICSQAAYSAGFAYFGLQNGVQCWGGNSYGSQGTASNCNMACTGSSDICGGPWANSVWAMAAQQDYSTAIQDINIVQLVQYQNCSTGVPCPVATPDAVCNAYDESQLNTYNNGCYSIESLVFGGISALANTLPGNSTKNGAATVLNIVLPIVDFVIQGKGGAVAGIANSGFCLQSQPGSAVLAGSASPMGDNADPYMCSTLPLLANTQYTIFGMGLDYNLIKKMCPNAAKPGDFDSICFGMSICNNVPSIAMTLSGTLLACAMGNPSFVAATEGIAEILAVISNMGLDNIVMGVSPTASIGIPINVVDHGVIVPLEANGLIVAGFGLKLNFCPKCKPGFLALTGTATMLLNLGLEVNANPIHRAASNLMTSGASMHDQMVGIIGLLNSMGHNDIMPEITIAGQLTGSLLVDFSVFGFKGLPAFGPIALEADLLLTNFANIGVDPGVYLYINGGGGTTVGPLQSIWNVISGWISAFGPLFDAILPSPIKVTNLLSKVSFSQSNGVTFGISVTGTYFGLFLQIPISIPGFPSNLLTIYCHVDYNNGRFSCKVTLDKDYFLHVLKIIATEALWVAQKAEALFATGGDIIAAISERYFNAAGVWTNDAITSTSTDIKNGVIKINNALNAMDPRGTFQNWLSSSCGGTKLVTDLAKCGSSIFSDIEHCGSAIAQAVAACGSQVYNDVAHCGSQLITDAGKCGVSTITDAAICGYQSVGNCVLSGFRNCRKAASCSKINSCNWPNTCTLPNTCTAPTCTLPNSCSVPNCWKTGDP